jgi:hypothetical protein
MQHGRRASYVRWIRGPRGLSRSLAAKSAWIGCMCECMSTTTDASEFGFSEKSDCCGVRSGGYVCRWILPKVVNGLYEGVNDGVLVISIKVTIHMYIIADSR